jgi:hypothetical protein
MAAVLAERQQKCLEHAKQARDLGVSFAEFCRSHDLNRKRVGVLSITHNF